MALLRSQACVEEAFVSASASSVFRYHLIKDPYCFAACSNSSLLRNPVQMAASFGFLAVERKILCVFSLSSAATKSTGTLHLMQTKFLEGRDSGKRDPLFYSFGILNPFSLRVILPLVFSGIVVKVMF